MGTSSSKQRTTPTSDPTSTPNPNTSILSHKDYDDEFDTQIQSEMHNCCGVQLNKKKKGNDMLNWEDTAVIGCQRAGEGVCWVEAIRQVVKKKGGNRKKFIREYNDIKYLQKQPTKSQREAPLNAAQISNFKSNLKKSVLLHPTQVLHPSQQPNANTAHISFRQSLRQQNLHSSILRQNPKKSLITENKQNNVIVKDNVAGNRDDSILSISRITKAVNRENLRQSVIGLVDDTVSSMFKGQEQEVIKLNAYQLQVFVKFTVMLQRHLTDPQHKINQIILAFCSSLYKSYPQFLKPNSQTLLLLQMQHYLDTIKLFLSFLTQIVLDYYNLSQAPQPPLPKDTTLSVIQMKSFHSNTANQQVHNHLINNYQNIYTIVTAILFKDQKFYNFVFEAVRAFNKQHDSRAARLFSMLHGRGPQCFNVRKEYCLNSGTLKNIIDGMSLQSNIQNLVPQDLCSTTDQPYKKCSEPLKKLQKQRTPISKMKSILECAQKITEQITQFYENNNTNININYKMIDADQVLSIFCYILSINKIQHIYSHCFIIQHFATEFQKMSMTGYYYSVVCCAVEEDFGEDRLEKEEQLQMKMEQQQKKKQSQEKKIKQMNEQNIHQKEPVENGNKQKAVDNGNKQQATAENMPIIANSVLSSKLQANEDNINNTEEKVLHSSSVAHQ